MRVTETHEETITRHRVVKTVCDLCKREVAGDGWLPGNRIDQVEVEVQLTKHQSGLGMYSTGESISFDICPDCFTNELIPWFKERGVEPTEVDW